MVNVKTIEALKRRAMQKRRKRWKINFRGKEITKVSIVNRKLFSDFAFVDRWYSLVFVAENLFSASSVTIAKAGQAHVISSLWLFPPPPETLIVPRGKIEGQGTLRLKHVDIRCTGKFQIKTSSRDFYHEKISKQQRWKSYSRQNNTKVSDVCCILLF